MYYITNQANQIIATDRNLLELLSLKNMDDLYKKIALDEISFSSIFDEKITITTILAKNSYHVQEFKLQSLLGEMSLIQISKENLSESTSLDESLIIDPEVNDKQLSEESDTNSSVEDMTELTPLTDDSSSFLKNDNDIDSNIFENESFVQEEHLEETLNLDEEDEDNTISLLNTDTIDLLETSNTELTKESENIKTEDIELFDLVSPDTDNIIEKNISLDKESNNKVIQQDSGPIIIDVDSISKEIGISTEDYDNFLNEYIDTALKLEDDLKSDESEKHFQAITTLSHLSNVLHLPMITKIITQVEGKTGLDRNQSIQTLYSTLTRLTTNKNISILPMDDLPVLEEEQTSIGVDIPESFGSINLNGIQPIHFDFQLEEAANDLSLPVELIEEFVHDFIEQAHTETKNMLDAYKKGDLDTIQKIGHMLKGASSNLRIKALSDTLYKIQFCEKSEEMEDLIKDYWGHFLAFETQINLTSQ